MHCVYSDVDDVDYFALVLVEHAEPGVPAAFGPRDLVIVRNGKVATVRNVPHRSALVTLVQQEEVRNKHRRLIQRATHAKSGAPILVPKRQAGAYWRD